MSEETKYAGAFMKNVLRAQTALKKLWYKGSREDYSKLKADETREYTVLNQDLIEAAIWLNNMLHVIEHEHWTDKDHHGEKSMEVVNARITKTAMMYGPYNNLDFATMERKYYKYGTVQGLKVKDDDDEDDENDENLPPYPIDRFEDARMRMLPIEGVEELYKKMEEGKLLNQVEFMLEMDALLFSMTGKHAQGLIGKKINESALEILKVQPIEFKWKTREQYTGETKVHEFKSLYDLFDYFIKTDIKLLKKDFKKNKGAILNWFEDITNYELKSKSLFESGNEEDIKLGQEILKNDLIANYILKFKLIELLSDKDTSVEEKVEEIKKIMRSNAPVLIENIKGIRALEYCETIVIDENNKYVRIDSIESLIAVLDEYVVEDIDSFEERWEYVKEEVKNWINLALNDKVLENRENYAEELNKIQTLKDCKRFIKNLKGKEYTKTKVSDDKILKIEISKICEKVRIKPFDSVYSLLKYFLIISSEKETKEISEEDIENISEFIIWANNYKIDAEILDSIKKCNDYDELERLARKKIEDMSSDMESIKLTREEFDTIYNGGILKFKIPPELIVTFPDGYKHFMRTWGWRYVNAHKNTLEKVVSKIIKLSKHYLINVQFYKSITSISDINERNNKIEIIKRNMEKMYSKSYDFSTQLCDVMFSAKIGQNLVNSKLVGESGFEQRMRRYPNDAQRYYKTQYMEDLSYLQTHNPGLAKETKKFVYCKHSYRVFIYSHYDKKNRVGLNEPTKPEYYEGKDNRDSLPYGYDLKIPEQRKQYENEMEIYQKEKSKFNEGIRKGEIIPVIPKLEIETEPGKDYRGMPLEVTEMGIGGEEFNNGTKCKVLSDEYNIALYNNRVKRGITEENEDSRLMMMELKKRLPPHNHPREIPREVYEKCTRYIDLPIMASYVENEWDAFRDDLRDGRYHKRTMTIYDYTLALRKLSYVKGGIGKNAPEKFAVISNVEANLTKKKIENDDITKARLFAMKLQYPEKYGKEGHFLIDERRPSNLNPAFDKRALYNREYQNYMHPGRVYYYDTVCDIDSDILPPEYDGHITTRGTAMYIIESVLNGGYYIKDAERLLNYIAEKRTGGLDYGPRNYAEHLTTHPLNPNTNVKV